eukprot:SAG11_NODE_406_length_9736_cov_3.229117_1_plen_1784_part_00
MLLQALAATWSAMPIHLSASSGLVLIPVGDTALGTSEPCPTLCVQESDPYSAACCSCSIGTPFNSGDYVEHAEHPQRTVTNVPAFHLAATEVTNAQHEKFDPDHRIFRGLEHHDGWSTGDNEPAVFDFHENATAYCVWLSAHHPGTHHRLPTELEWERAARAGDKNESWIPKLQCPCTRLGNRAISAVKSDDATVSMGKNFVTVQKDSSGMWWFAHRGERFLSKGVNHVNNGGEDDGVGGRESPACKAGVTRGVAKIPGSPLCGDTLSYSPLIGYSPYFNSTQERHGSEEKWANVTTSRLRSWNFNTLGGWSATIAEKAAATRGLYYAHLLDLGTTWLSHTGLDHDVFNASFSAQCQTAVAKQVAPRANDEQLLGWQLDNELNWQGLGLSSFLDGYRNLDGSTSNAGKEVAATFVHDHCAGKADDNCNWDWLGIVAEKYFAETVGAIRAVDSNHLILGMRGGVFCANANCSTTQAILRAAAKWIDVFDYHDYGDDPPISILETVHAVTGLPILLGEWSFTSFDSNMPNTGGSRSCRDPTAAGVSVALEGAPCLPGKRPGTHCPTFISQKNCHSVRTTQSQRANDYTRFVTELVKLPFAVGFHWWQWADEPSQGRWPDGECSNYGLVHISDDVYEVITQTITNAKLEAIHLNRSRSNGQVATAAKLDDEQVSKIDDKQVASAQNVFIGGQDGYNCYRLPSVVAVPRTHGVLIFAQGRKFSCSDFGWHDIVLKRSTDGGANFGPMQLIHSESSASSYIKMGGAVAIALHTHPGTIVALASRNLSDVLMLSSTTAGWSWSPAKNITAEATRADWTGVGDSELGVQLADGRIFVTNHHKDANGISYSHALMSDDNGESWEVGGSVENGAECQAAQCLNGLLLMNMRTNSKNAKRMFSWSHDGRQWTKPIESPFNSRIYAGAHCEGSTVSLQRPGKESILAFSTPFATATRTNLSIFTSIGSGKSFEHWRRIDAGMSGYSSMTQLNSSFFGVVWEGNFWESGAHSKQIPSLRFASLELPHVAKPLLQSKCDDEDLTWVEQPQAWHQQAIRIVDHPFTNLAELRDFGMQAKKAGVSVVELVGPQKTKRCVGYWCGGLGLCDHINGSFPADDPVATLAEWQQMLKDIRPVRLMWWANFAYWSTQGEVSQQAMADPDSDVGRFFSYGPNASAFPVCPGKWLGNASDPMQHSYGYTNPCFNNPKTGKQLCAQGSWGSVSGNCNRSGYSNTSVCFDDKLMGCSKAVMERSDGGRCIPSLNANLAHQEYVDYLANALANSWSRNLGIDGFIVDTSIQVPCSPGINPLFGSPGGSEYIFYNDIIGRVRKTQPQVVLSGEDCSGWDDAIAHNFQLPGTKSSGPYQLALQAAVEAKNLDTIEDVVASSGADAATMICYLHPGLDGKPSGACPTLYYRDTQVAYSAQDVSIYRLWVALEAASGILSEHQHSPTAVFGQQYGSWNVSADPYVDDGKESPLWAFARSRALNRLALRTKLNISTSPQFRGERSDPFLNYTLYQHSNCYHAPHGGVVLPRTGAWLENQTAASCVALCTTDEKCDCVTYQARAGNPDQLKSQYKCWPRASCDPTKFEHDSLTHCYDVYVKKTAPTPPPLPPSAAGGAIAYLKHDALGPRGDSAIVVFNPGVAQSLTVDLSMLPTALFASKIVPTDLFTNVSASTPLDVKWTATMEASSFAAFGFRGLGVFAPRRGKFKQCVASDGYSKLSQATTLQSCFFECKHDIRCENVFVNANALPRWLEKPGPITCTLLGAVASTKTSCLEVGSGTLVRMLDARPHSSS